MAPHEAHAGQSRSAHVLQGDRVFEELVAHAEGDVLQNLQVATDQRSRSGRGGSSSSRCILHFVAAVVAQGRTAAELVTGPEALLGGAGQEVVDNELHAGVVLETLGVGQHADAGAHGPLVKFAGGAAVRAHLANEAVRAEAKLDVFAAQEDTGARLAVQRLRPSVFCRRGGRGAGLELGLQANKQTGLARDVLALGPADAHHALVRADAPGIRAALRPAATSLLELIDALLSVDLGAGAVEAVEVVAGGAQRHLLLLDHARPTDVLALDLPASALHVVELRAFEHVQLGLVREVQARDESRQRGLWGLDSAPAGHVHAQIPALGAHRGRLHVWRPQPVALVELVLAAGDVDREDGPPGLVGALFR
mmetsp:Transcript_85434/g.245364  ORF Transcript_85434/g.245364 Transcript_85434/m.245364 type:complete len:366 (+) Transcript_85434:611-1708(+)